MQEQVAPSRTLLIVDDDEDLRTALAETLRFEGYEVLEACNGREALERLAVQPAPPDAIVLDLMMPVMNGWQFRELQLRIPFLREVPVLVVSATEGDPPPAEALLRKPFRLRELLEAVARLADCCAPVP